MGPFKRILQRLHSDNILKMISSRRLVYFENLTEEIAFRFVPGEKGKTGRYYAKHWGRNEYEIEANSTSVVMGVMEGKRISREKYESYHLVQSAYWSRKLNDKHIDTNYGYYARG